MLVQAEIVVWRANEIRYNKNFKNIMRKTKEEAPKAKFERINEQQERKRMRMEEELVNRDKEILPMICLKFQTMVASFTPENPQWRRS